MDVIIAERGFRFQVEGLDESVGGRSAAGSPEFGSQQAHVEDALRRIPTGHLVAIPLNIIVGDRPSSGGAFVASPPAIGLNRGTFAASWNRRYLFTLIHEIGHAVDRHFRIVSRLIRATERSGADWNSYRAIEYRGRNRIRSGPDAGTPAYGEHFAEGYAHLLTRPHRLTRAQQSLIRRLARM